MAWRRSCAPTLGPTISALRMVKVLERNSCSRATDHRRRDAVHALQFVEVRDDAAVILVARVGELLRQLIVAIAGIHAERERILLREVGGQSRRRHGIEIRLARCVAAEGLVENVQDLLLAGVERLIALALLLETDHDVVLRAGDPRCR